VTDDVNGRYLRNSNERKLQTVTKTVLVIRAIASDVSTTASESALSDDIFGTSGDAVNLKSQYAQCSDGKLQFEPLTTNTLVGTDGVYTISLLTTVIAGSDYKTIENAMTAKAASDLGAPLTSIANHVMLCMPKGTIRGMSADWLAYAYVNYWLSVYNDEWCRYPSAQLHEIGESHFKLFSIMNQRFLLNTISRTQFEHGPFE
jgi:hypothetical protein